MLNIIKKLVDPKNYNIKCPNSMAAEYITVHNTANDSPAANEILYMSTNPLERSFHFAVDDKEIVQGIPLDRNAWHAGDGNGPGNRKSIAVEICYSKSGGERYKKAESLAIKLIAQLLFERKWEVERVAQHSRWSNKNCPHRIREEGRWNSFISSIRSELNALRNPPKPVINYYPKVAYTGDSITTALKMINIDSSFANRSKIAIKNSISGYKGTSTQNTQMLKLLLAGKLIK